jgi:hypothetical protein
MAWRDDQVEVGECPFCGFPMLLPAADEWRCPSCDADGFRRLPDQGPRTGAGGPGRRDR